MFDRLKTGDILGLVSPAFIPDNNRVIEGVKYLQHEGYQVRAAENLNKKHGYFAGTERERLDDLHDMYTDTEVKMILCTRGGWGGLRMIDKIGYDLVAENPKPLVGYSDITTLQLAIYRMTGIPSISGPMVGVEMGKGIHPFTAQHFWGQIYNKALEYKFNFEDTQTKILRGGKTDGILLGGCLSMVAGLMGSPFSPDYTNNILYLEDIGEKPYKIDRYLAQLRQSGILKSIGGLILGDFIDCVAEEGDTSFTIDEILADYFSNAPYPVISHFPYGHGDVKFSMPTGVHVKLDTKRKILTLNNPFYQVSQSVFNV
jgi:muramoyltetrapeptide carboxypeptidase